MRFLLVLLVLLASPAHAEDVIVTADWLAAHPEVRIVDMRPAAAYLEAHVPGAVHLSERALAKLPDSGTVKRLAETLGIAPTTHVVAYDDQGGKVAARLWLVLTAYGHPRVSVLDGGFQAWTGPTDAEQDPPAAATWVPNGEPTRICGAIDVLARAPGTLLVDVRSAEEFSGAKKSRGALKAGHIPGAVNVPSGDFSVIPRDRPVIVYCSDGGRAALAALTLSRLGCTDVRVYYGSFADWTRRSVTPVVKPAGH